MPRGVYVRKDKFPKLTFDFLNVNYSVQKRTPEDIAKNSNCCRDTIFKYLRRYNIPIRNISDALIGNKRLSLALKGKKEPNKSIARSQYITRHQSKKKGFYNTKPEIKMKGILKLLGFHYQHSYPVWNIKHQYPADFFIPSLNLIIEVDGKFWHKYPYGTDLDRIRTFELQQAGYKVIRFWENEFNEILVKEKITQVCHACVSVG